MKKVVCTIVAIIATYCGIINAANQSVSLYGDQLMQIRNDMISLNFAYGIPSHETKIATISTGQVTHQTNVAVLSTGKSSSGCAQMESTQLLRYRSGYDGYAVFTVAFSSGVADSYQWVGLYDDDDGAAIGCDGNQFAILFRLDGNDTIVHQSQFNSDKLNSLGASRLPLDPTCINVFRIVYGGIGPAIIQFQILDQTSNWITFHEIRNVHTTTTYFDPVLPMRAEVCNVGNTTDLMVKTSSWNAGIVGQPTTCSSRFYSVVSELFRLDKNNEQHLLTLKNNDMFLSKPNKVPIRIAYINAGSADTGTEASLIRLRKNASVYGSFASLNVDSVVSVLKKGSFSGGDEVLTLVNNSRGNGPVLTFLPKESYDIILYPGETITLTVQSLSGSNNEVIGSIGWEELH